MPNIISSARLWDYFWRCLWRVQKPAMFWKRLRPRMWVCLKIVYPYTQWLMIIIPTKWLFHWEYTPFSDIPMLLGCIVADLLMEFKSPFQVDIYSDSSSALPEDCNRPGFKIGHPTSDKSTYHLSSYLGLSDGVCSRKQQSIVQGPARSAKSQGKQLHFGCRCAVPKEMGMCHVKLS